MQVRIGTSGFSFKAWRGAFYPEKLPEARFLAHYASILHSVELNNTFYRMPTVNALSAWREQVPVEFRFAIKAPRLITHILRLKGTQDALDTLVERLSSLEDRLGVVLFQLPPNLKLDLPRLAEFLAALKGRLPAAVEFRNASWFDAAVLDVLRAEGVALCVGEPEKDEQAAPWLTTSQRAYVRLRKDSYTPQELVTWAERVRGLGAAEVYVFFKHEVQGPAYAAELKRLLETPALPPP